MRYPQLLVYESDGRLADFLKATAQIYKWSFRESRQPESCLRLLRRGGPGVLVVKLGGDLVRELSLVEQVASHLPEAAAVVVGETEDPALAAVAWDLGARFVHFPPQPRDQLLDIVTGIMEQVMRVRPRVEPQKPISDV